MRITLGKVIIAVLVLGAAHVAIFQREWALNLFRKGVQKAKGYDLAETPNEALVQLKASKPIREGLEVTTAGGVVIVRGREDDLWRVAFPASALEFFERWGDVPLPPYIHRAPDANDRERYQSI